MMPGSRPVRRRLGLGGAVRGLTYLEVVVATALLALVVAALLPLLSAGQQSWEELGPRQSMVQNARLALDKIMREVRAAEGFAVISPTLLRFTVFSDRATADTPWWDANWQYRRRTVVTTGANRPAGGYDGYTVTLDNMDTRSLVAAGRMQADCDDLRVLRWNGTLWTELDRRILSCNTRFTDIVFKLRADIANSSSDQNYFVYYGNGAAPAGPANMLNVYYYFDTFEGYPEGTVLTASGWTSGGAAAGTAWTVVTFGGSKRVRFASPDSDSWLHKNGYGAEADYLIQASFQNAGASFGSACQWGNCSRSAVLGGADWYWYGGRNDGGIFRSVAAAKFGTSMTSSTNIGSTDESWAVATWYTIASAHWGTNQRMWRNGGLRASGTHTAYTGAGFFGFCDDSPGTKYWDNLIVRRYTQPEPTVTLQNTITVEYQLNGATNEVEYRVLPDPFHRLAGQFRSMSVQCFNASGLSIACTSVASVRSVQVALVAMDPLGRVPDITVTSRAYRQSP